MPRSLNRIVEKHRGTLHAQLTTSEGVALDEEGLVKYDNPVFLALPFVTRLSFLSDQ